jgi:hypothetical protein
MSQILKRTALVHVQRRDYSGARVGARTLVDHDCNNPDKE